MALPYTLPFTLGAPTTPASGWYQEPTGAIRTIRQNMATVIQCLGAVDVTKVPISELDGLIVTGGTQWNLTTPVNLTKFEFVNVEFTESLTSLGVGNAAAKTAVHTLIDELPVGTELIFVGFSEGAAVLSDIYDEIRTGALSARSGDLLAGVMYGNPRRETGITLTDPTYGLYPDPLVGGSGISSTPLASTDSSWWECALPGDPVPCQLNTSDHTNPAYWARQFYIAVEAGQNIQTVLDAASAEGFAQNSACFTAANSLLNLATSPHNNYVSAKPFQGGGDTRTFLQVGVDHINSQTVSVPAPQAHRYEDGPDHAVGPGQVITAGADVMWTNLPAFAGAAITISVDVFDDTDTLIANITSPTTTITGSSNSPYQKLSGSFTMPDGAHHARLIYEVAQQVMTTGIVRFKDPFFLGGFAVVSTALATINPKLLELKEIMLHEPDTLSRAIASNSIAEFQETNNDKTWVVTIYDYLWRPLGELGDDLMELTGTDPRNNVPTATLKVKGGSQHIDTFKDCARTLVGITVETGGLRQAFYVDVFDWEYKEAEWVGTAQLKGIWDVLSFLVVWPNFLFPIQVQIPSHAVFIGPIVSVINTMVAECAFRIQTGLWEFVNNALSLNPDIRAWFGTLLQSNGNFFDMLKTPVYVSGINPFADSSPLVARTVRMETCTQVILDITRAYGVDVRVDLWLPGDEQPDEWTKAFPMLGLNQPTYVVSTVDRSQIEGPTKTIIDSVLRTVVDLIGSFFGDIDGLIESVPGMTGAFQSPLLGVNFVKPWAVVVAPDIGEKGSVATCKLSFHTPKGWQHIIGGRSPKWLNDLMNALFGWILDAISIFIGLIGIPSDLLSGLLNNAFLAFQLMEHYGRRNQVGPYHPGIEVMHPTPTAPYNIECVSGDTVVQGPDGDERIDVLAADGGPFRVWSITPDGQRVAATATLAFKKGTAELFEYVLDDGRSIKATHAHRFLTSEGFVHAGDVTINTLFATVDHQELSDQLLDVSECDVIDADYESIPATEAVTFRRLVSIRPAGVDDFYDMHVPGWENYSANGFWNHNTVFGFVNAYWDSRGYVSGQFTFRDGDVYKYGRDIFRGGLVSLVFDGRKKLFTDYVELVMYAYGPDRRDVIVQVGDGKAEESPLAKHQRFITAAIESVNVLTLAPQS